MKKLKFLRVQFDTEIRNSEIAAFRGAIATKVGLEHDMFHNHLPDDKLAYRYPLIQYKCIGRNPAILCLGEGVEEIHHFFEKRNWDIILHNRTVEMKIAKLDLNQFTMQVWDKKFRYTIRNWIALNQKSYMEYLQLEGLVDKTNYLEHKLIAHIILFAKGINWTVEQEIQVKVLEMYENQAVRVKDQKLMGFNLCFESNVFLPNYIGLGGKVSLGFGVVKKGRV